jgi:serine/threonine-protein kinase HipA
MAKILDVYFHEKIIGQLEQDNHGDINFKYSANWLNDPNATRISCSLPLQETTFSRKYCRAFFENILPEENQRKIIAKNLGISANNDFSMLEKIGGECAGALSFMPAGEKLSSSTNEYHELIGSALPNIIRELPARPLLAGEQGIRLSLAGVQDKLAVFVENGKIFIPLNNAPSTHILKPDFGRFEGVIFNEAFCLKLAKQLGLSVADAEINQTEDINYLLIKRYDRIFADSETSKNITRIHQEDFCQALNILSTNKYQTEGGPSFKQCFDLIRRESSLPVIDLEKMLNGVIFNFLIGNCDAHGKNYSFLYSQPLQLAPLYDLISTIYYRDLSPKMAMKLGGEYVINDVNANNFDKLADEISFAKPQVRRRILELIDGILLVLLTMEAINPIQEGVANLIKTRCEKFAIMVRASSSRVKPTN